MLNRIKIKVLIPYVTSDLVLTLKNGSHAELFFISLKQKINMEDYFHKNAKWNWFFQGNFSRKSIDFWHFVVRKKTFMKNWTSFLRQRSQVLWSKILQRIEFLRNSFKSKDLKTVHSTHNLLDTSRNTYSSPHSNSKQTYLK